MNNASRLIYRQISVNCTIPVRIESTSQRSTRTDSDQSNQQNYIFGNTSDRTDHAEPCGGENWKTDWKELACAIYLQA